LERCATRTPRAAVADDREYTKVHPGRAGPVPRKDHLQATRGECFANNRPVMTPAQNVFYGGEAEGYVAFQSYRTDEEAW